MMKCLFHTSLLLLISSMALGQTRYVWTHQIDDLKNEVAVRQPITSDFGEVEGSPYLYEEFKEGGLILKTGQRFADIPMRINIAHDELEYKYNNTILALSNNMMIGEVILKKDTFVCEAYQGNNRFEQAFFQRIVNGKAQLLKKINIRLAEAEPEKPFVNTEPAKYLRQPASYYVKTPDQLPVRISKIKKLIHELEVHQKEMSTYAKKEKISAKNEDELIKFISYYNRLVVAQP